MSNKRNVVGLVVVVVVILAGVACWYYGNKMTNQYSVVYLTTGEVYVGKLATFGDFKLRDAYILLVSQDPADKTKNNFQLNPIKDALWAPEYLNLVRKNVVFYGPLSPESNIAKTLAAQQAPAPAPAE